MEQSEEHLSEAVEDYEQDNSPDDMAFEQYREDGEDAEEDSCRRKRVDKGKAVAGGKGNQRSSQVLASNDESIGDEVCTFPFPFFSARLLR